MPSGRLLRLPYHRSTRTMPRGGVVWILSETRRAISAPGPRRKRFRERHSSYNRAQSWCSSRRSTMRGLGTMKDSDSADSPLRRQVFKALTFVPLSAIGLVACSNEEAGGPARSGVQPKEYQPAFFDADQWKFLHAACDRLIPQDEIGPGDLKPRDFMLINRNRERPYAR